LKIFHVSADDVGPIGDLFVKAKSREDAVKFFKEYFVKELTIQSINECVDADEFPEDYADMKEGVVEEEH